jgi:aspartate racemase
MKSFIGRYVNRCGEARLFLAHCRADQRLNSAKLSDALATKEHLDLERARLSNEEMEALGLEYGIVSPWQTWDVQRDSKARDGEIRSRAHEVEQVFDDDLLQPIGTPGTVMTNAGALTWAVEFHPRELVAKLPNARVTDIAEPDPEEEPRLWGVKDDRPIGIITGNPPEAGMALWRLINDKVRSALGNGCCGDVSMPRMEVVSVPEMGLSMELEARLAPVEAALEKATRELAGRGVKLLALPCNTTSFFAPQIHQWCAGTPTRFLSMAEATGAWLRREGVMEVALVGINYVADLGHWSAYCEPLAGMKIELLNGEALERVRKLAYDVKAEGPNAHLLNKLRDILNKYVTSKHAVLALTELSLLLEFQKGASRKVLIDPMNLYAESLAREYLGLPSPPAKNTPTI